MKEKRTQLQNAVHSAARKPKQSHDAILTILTQRASDRTAPKKAKTRQDEQDLKLCVFVRRLQTDRTASDVVTDFISRFSKHRKFTWARVPTDLAWLAISPRGGHYFMFYWVKPDAHALALFEQFCTETGRSSAVLSADLTCSTGTEEFSFFDCKVIHQDELVAATSRPTKKIALTQIVRSAQALLAKRAGRNELIEEREFLSDHEAQDDQLQKSIRASFAKKAKSCEKELSKKFDGPLETGTAEHKDIPCNGVFQFAIWKVGKKHLYLAATHEDRELPVQLNIGTY